MAKYLIPTGQLETNTYVIAEAGEAIIIDPGDDHDKITELLKAHELKASYVLITHGHFDHIGAVAAFKRDGAKVYISELDYKMLKALSFRFDFGYCAFDVERFEPDVLLSDGDSFELLGHKFKVMLTPGHTPGGVCYIVDDNAIYSGDTLFNLGVGRTDLQFGDGAQLTESLKAIFALAGDYDVYPGHGGKTTLRFERAHNPYARIV